MSKEVVVCVSRSTLALASSASSLPRSTCLALLLNPTSSCIISGNVQPTCIAAAHLAQCAQQGSTGGVVIPFVPQRVILGHQDVAAAVHDGLAQDLHLHTWRTSSLMYFCDKTH